MPKVWSYSGKFWAGYEPGRSALWAGPGSPEWAVYAVILGFSAISQPFVKIEASNQKYRLPFGPAEFWAGRPGRSSKMKIGRFSRFLFERLRRGQGITQKKLERNRYARIDFTGKKPTKIGPDWPRAKMGQFELDFSAKNSADFDLIF